MFTSGGVKMNFIRLARLGVVVFLLVLGSWSGADDAEAATNLAGYPSGANGLMSLANSPYIVTGDITVNNGNTLTIEPGVVVKMQANRAIVLLNGNIIIGSASNPSPVVITSYKDDTYGGDTNNDVSATSPAAGDWKYIQASSASTQMAINNALIRYGGSSSAMIQILSGAHATIASSTIENGNNTGIGLRNGDSVLTLTNSIVRGHYEGLTISFQADATITGSTFSNNRRGIAIDTDADVANLTISNNTFSGNNWAVGVPTPAGLDFADADDTLIAINNDWGSASGPTIASNPSGTGDRIIGNVTYSPWTGQNQAPVLSYVATSGYVSDGVEPNVSFNNSTLPVFKVLYSDAENAVSYVRLVTASSTVAMATSTGGVYEYTAATSTFAKASYSYHFEASDGAASVRLPATGELSFEVKNIPVILVPGIMGTVMKQGDDLLWPDIFNMTYSLSDGFMDALIMDSNGLSSNNEIVVDDIVRNLLNGVYDVFDGLIQAFQDDGFVENEDLFVFPYDWRLDIRTTSINLKDKINTVKSQTGASKADIVAHSMGGLLAKQYILDNGSSSIDKLIFVGTPHLGSPKAAKALLYGDNLGVIAILNPLEVRQIGRDMLSIYELLPSALSIAQNGHYFYDLTTDQTTFTYTELNQYFAAQNLNSNHLQTASLFHSSALDNFDTAGIDAYNIVGCDTATIGNLVVQGRFGDLTEYQVGFVPGDGTVPLNSAASINIPNNKVFYARGVEHATMPSQDSIRQLMARIVAGNTSIDGLTDISQNSNQCIFNGNIVSSHSPVNLHVYDNLGNHAGPDANGDIELNIPGATYEQVGDNKFIFIPSGPGLSYQIQLDATDNGTFSVRVSTVADNEVTATAYYSDIPVSESGAATVTLADSVSNTVLQVDQNGTGSFVQESISAVLDSAEAADITQPGSTITVSGGQTQATVSISATDDNAGVLKIEYSLNNGATWQTYSSSFIITTIGATSVQYRATDRAGNVEATKSQVVTVTAAPNAVISIPSSATRPTSNDVVGQGSQVLGEQVERQQYTKEEVLDALSQAKTETLLDYLNKEPNPALEKKIFQDYSQGLALDQPAINFIAYGTKSTEKLGLGERVNVLRSYQYAFGKLPQTSADWQDAVNMATGQLPVKRNTKVEQEARVIVRKVYGKVDEKSVLFIAYGLRPTVRDIKKEQSGLSRFGKIFGRLPNSVFDWNVFRKLVY